jgi:hypothetical protein
MFNIENEVMIFFWELPHENVASEFLKRVEPKE